MGYWILLADGQVFPYGDAAGDGSPPAGDFGGLDAATRHLRHVGRRGATGSRRPWASVYNFGDAPNDGGMAGTHLNGAIIAATGLLT